MLNNSSLIKSNCFIDPISSRMGRLKIHELSQNHPEGATFILLCGTPLPTAIFAAYNYILREKNSLLCISRLLNPFMFREIQFSFQAVVLFELYPDRSRKTFVRSSKEIPGNFYNIEVMSMA